MEVTRPSRTAARVALRRAAHQLYDSQPLILDDPLAVQILGSEFAEELRKTETRLEKPHSRALRAFLVARSRYAEDCVAQAYASGIRQYCVLGAGLDTFAYRNTHAHLQVFEVDHPATQHWKLALMERNSILIPDRVTHVPVDFETQSLEVELSGAGLDSSAPTMFAWLGVVPYLTLDAFRRVIGFVLQRPAGSGIVLDYGLPRSALPPLEQLARDSLASRVALAGESFQLFLRPEEMREELNGFATVEDLGVTEINTLYFCGRTDDLRVYGSAGRLVSAWL